MLRLALLACLSLVALPVAAQTSAPSQSETVDAQKADVDSRINDSIRIASDAQAYFLTPHDFGGGNNSFNGLTLETLGYTTDEAGHFVRTFSQGNATHTYALDLRDGVVSITATSSTHDAVIVTTFDGPKAQDISVSF